VYSGNFDVPANGKVKIAPIAAMKGQGILLISYKVGDKQLGNHYLYGNPPFKLDNYKSLLKKTKLFEIK
jgi:beta-mannosidase